MKGFNIVQSLFKTKETKDYTALFNSLMNTYTEVTKSTGGYFYRSVYYTYTTKGVESKKYNHLKNAMLAMTTKAKVKAL